MCTFVGTSSLAVPDVNYQICTRCIMDTSTHESSSTPVESVAIVMHLTELACVLCSLVTRVDAAYNSASRK